MVKRILNMLLYNCQNSLMDNSQGKTNQSIKLSIIKNKKGWLRLVEAMIAILMVLGVILTVSTRRGAVVESDLSEMIRPIADEIAGRADLRAMVLAGDSGLQGIKEFVEPKIPAMYGWDVKICSLEKVCGLGEVDRDTEGNIYAVERIITTTPSQTGYNPKKVKIFVWRKA